MSKLPLVIQNIIFEYEPRYELLEWIDKNKLIGEYFKYLLENHRAINIIEEMIGKHPYMFADNPIYIRHLSCNKNAIHLLEEHIHKINWFNASKYLPMSFLQKYPDKIRKGCLSQNPSAIKYIEQNINFFGICCRLYMNPSAFHLLNDLTINTCWLSRNPSAINYLKNNPHIIYWDWLLGNKNGIDMIKNEIAKPINRINQYYVKTDPTYRRTSIDNVYKYLSINENAMEILQHNQHLIYWCWFAKNKSIFRKINYFSF